MPTEKKTPPGPLASDVTWPAGVPVPEGYPPPQLDWAEVSDDELCQEVVRRIQRERASEE